MVYTQLVLLYRTFSFIMTKIGFLSENFFLYKIMKIGIMKLTAWSKLYKYTASLLYNVLEASLSTFSIPASIFASLFVHLFSNIKLYKNHYNDGTPKSILNENKINFIRPRIIHVGIMHVSTYFASIDKGYLRLSTSLILHHMMMLKCALF